MFPACIIIAATAIFSGISGAGLLTPLIMVGFPLMGAPRLTRSSCCSMPTHGRCRNSLHKWANECRFTRAHPEGNRTTTGSVLVLTLPRFCQWDWNAFHGDDAVALQTLDSG